MKKMTLAALALSAMAVAISGCAKNKKETTAQAPANYNFVTTGTPAYGPSNAPLTYQDSAKVATTARVDAVDYTTRQVTLRDDSGRVVKLHAGPEVQRLNEVRPGDTVKAEYNVSLLAELRPPTAEEAASPISVVDVTGRSPRGTDPTAEVTRGVRLVTTVQAVDPVGMLVTLKGPMGDTTTVRGRNPDNVRRLRVGDTIVITYIESGVISLIRTGR